MIYFKSTLFGFIAVVLGFVVTPFVVLMRVRWLTARSGIGAMAGGFNLVQLMHTMGFWVFVLVLFSAGFSLSALFLKR